MKQYFVLFLYFCGTAVFTGLGIAILFRPMAVMRLIDRLSGLDRWTRPNPEWSPRHQIEARIAGFIMALLGSIMLVVPLYWVLSLGVPGDSTPESGPAKASRIELTSVFLSLAMFALGVWLSVKPQIILWWSKKAAPHRIFPGTVPSYTFVVFRLIGILLIALGLYQIAALLGKTPVH